MEIQFYMEKLSNSDKYKEFMKKNPKAYFYSGFFSFDKKQPKNPNNEAHLDFFVPEKEEVYSFKVHGQEIVLTPITIYDKKIPEKIPFDISLDFDFLQELIFKEIEKRKVKKKVEKFLFNLQSKDKENFILATVFLSGLGLLKLTIDLKDNKIRDFEKKSIFDMVNVFKGGKKKK